MKHITIVRISCSLSYFHIMVNRYIYIHVSGDFHTVKPSSKKISHEESTDGLPSKFRVHFSLRERNITLSLQRNYRINTGVPITVERYGKLIYQPINDTEEIAYYHDIQQVCSVMAQPAKRKHQHDFEFFGTVHIDSKVYLIQPPDDTHYTHSLTEIQYRYNSRLDVDIVQGHLQNDTIPSFDYPKTTIQHRNRRRTTKLYEVEILVVVDFSEYSFWRNRLSGNASTQLDIQAKSNLRQYYTLLIHSTDLFYQSVTGRGFAIRLLLARLQVSDKISTSWWTESLKDSSTSPPSIDGDAALKHFRNWVVDHEMQLPGFDHAMLFTRYHLNDNQISPSKTVGLAYTGTICGRDKTSLVQNNLDIYTSLTAAHELGHSLGANHDGEGNMCLKSDGYIMAASSPYYINNAVNSQFWKFSSCSLNYFDALIQSLNRKHENCMATRSAKYTTNIIDDNELLGQIYAPDTQCQFLFGPESKMLRGRYRDDHTLICSKFNCSLNSTHHWTTIPLDGTVCGDGKICMKGSCITSVNAPKGLSDSCLHGDNPGILPDLNRTCLDILSHESLHFYCNDRYFALRCCETCAIVSTLRNWPNNPSQSQDLNLLLMCWCLIMGWCLASKL